MIFLKYIETVKIQIWSVEGLSPDRPSLRIRCTSLSKNRKNRHIFSITNIVSAVIIRTSGFPLSREWRHRGVFRQAGTADEAIPLIILNEKALRCFEWVNPFSAVNLTNFVWFLVGGGFIPPQDLSGDKPPTYPYYLTHTKERRTNEKYSCVGVGVWLIKPLQNWART